MMTTYPATWHRRRPVAEPRPTRPRPMLRRRTRRTSSWPTYRNVSYLPVTITRNTRADKKHGRCRRFGVLRIPSRCNNISGNRIAHGSPFEYTLLGTVAFQIGFIDIHILPPPRPPTSRPRPLRPPPPPPPPLLWKSTQTFVFNNNSYYYYYYCCCCCCCSRLQLCYCNRTIGLSRLVLEISTTVRP